MSKKRDLIKQVEQADIEVSRKAAEVRDTPVVRALGAFGTMGDQEPMIAFVGGLGIAGLIRRDRKLLRAAGRALAAHLLSTLAKTMVKRSVDRTRPRLLVEEGRYERGKGERNEGAYNSFPSGHTAGAVAVARALARDYPETAWIGTAAAGTIAAVQVPRCNHFASDTVAGALIGLTAETMVSKTIDRAGLLSNAN